MSEYCRHAEIPLSSFSKWLSKEKENPLAKEDAVADHLSNSFSFEVILPNGVQIKFLEPKDIYKLLPLIKAL
jgi:hypothetical protein